MQKARYISLVVLLLLIIYLGATALFAWFFRRTDFVPVARTLAPTFTPAPIVVATVSPIATPTLPPTATPTSTSTATPTSSPTSTPLPPTPTSTPVVPRVIAATGVNVRAGPGTNYPVVAQLPPNLPMTAVGRNAEATWWQIQGPDGSKGWVSGSVVQATNTGNVPIAAAPPPPVPPTPVPTPIPAPPPTPEQPKHQYEPTGWFDDTNYGLTRFLGNITDANGNPVNGVYVRAQCGDFSVISNPSGSTTWAPGFYDITLDTKPIPCQWLLSVVDTADQKTVKAVLSEVIMVETTINKSIVTANWRKNW